MSASRWSQCPKCYNKAFKAEINYLNKMEKLDEMSAKEYLELQAHKPISASQIEKTLREDWKFGLHVISGIFYGTYWASCKVCGFEFKHNFT